MSLTKMGGQVALTVTPAEKGEDFFGNLSRMPFSLFATPYPLTGWMEEVKVSRSDMKSYFMLHIQRFAVRNFGVKRVLGFRAK